MRSWKKKESTEESDLPDQQRFKGNPRSRKVKICENKWIYEFLSLSLSLSRGYFVPFLIPFLFVSLSSLPFCYPYPSIRLSSSSPSFSLSLFVLSLRCPKTP